MGRRVVVLLALLLAVGLLVLGAPAATAATAESSRLLSARLTGEAEVPGPGDPNGVGSARIRLGNHRVCFTLRWSRIAPPTAAHIHVGPPGVAGPVVVPLFAAPAGLPPELSGVSGCVKGVDPGLIRAIRRHPRQYYVNIHNAPFPDGAIRGQLHRIDD
jgi:CHRD domain-containing protein